MCESTTKTNYSCFLYITRLGIRMHKSKLCSGPTHISSPVMGNKLTVTKKLEAYVRKLRRSEKVKPCLDNIVVVSSIQGKVYVSCQKTGQAIVRKN